MIETTKERTSFEQDVVDSTDQVSNIISLVDYSFERDFKNIENPNILILGIGPFFPEAILLKKYSESIDKKIDITCVDEKMPLRDYPELLFNLKNNDNFSMDLIAKRYENLSLETNSYDLILLLRSSNLSLLNRDIFNNIYNGLKANGVFIISGGVKDEIDINSLVGNNLQLECIKKIPQGTKDYWNSYVGTNTVAKFKKNENDI